MPHLHLDGRGNGYRATGIGDHLQLLVTECATVDVGRIRSEQARLPHRAQFAELARRPDADVDVIRIPTHVPAPNRVWSPQMSELRPASAIRVRS